MTGRETRESAGPCEESTRVCGVTEILWVAMRGDSLDVLVTGGAGFIGSHVVDRLLAGGHRPRIFDQRP